MGIFRDIAVACSGASAEYGWAVSEAVMIPHLLASPLSLSTATAGLIWLSSPTFGFFIGPAIGKSSDKTGQRRKWIIILALIAILSHVLLIISPTVKVSRIWELTIYFLAFGLMDLCHDLILIPGRALLVDQFAYRGCDVMGTEDGGIADTIYTTMQIVGCMGGRLVCTFPIENLFSLKVSHYQASLVTSAAVLLLANSLAITFAQDKDSHIFVKDDSQYRDDSQYKDLELDDKKKSSSKAVVSRQRSETCVLGMVLIVQFIGWVASHLFNCLYTAWLGLETSLTGTSLSFPMVMMSVQAILSLFFSFYLPILNRRFPVAWVWMLSELIFLGSLCSCRWLGPENPYATIVILSIGTGPTNFVHITNSQLVARMVISEEHNIGWVAALLNNTVNLANIFVAFIFGIFVVCKMPTDGSTVPCPKIGDVLYFGIGLFGLLIDLLVLAIDTSCFEGRIFGIQTLINRRKRIKNLKKTPFPHVPLKPSKIIDI